MNAPNAAPGIPPRTLVLVFASMAALFALTTLLARWYAGQRLARAERYYEVGRKLALQGRPADAIEQYRNALNISRSRAQYRSAIADALMKLGRFDEAAIYYREVLASDSGDGASYLMLARIAAREGRDEEAVSDYHRSIYGYWPENAEQNRMTSRWELMELQTRVGTNKQVVAELLEIADQAPGDPATLKSVGRLLLRHGSAKQSADAYREALRINPRDGEALAGLGEAELAQGNYPAAESALRRALRDEAHAAKAKQDLEVVERVLALDPAAHGIKTNERYRRSVVLVERSLAAFQQCEQAKSPPAHEDLTAAARKAAAGREPGQSYADAADHNLTLAEQLWDARQAACGSAPPADPLLARVMARLSK
jgi:tetratricopeptide (TPR) repeat protein